ncbi:sulfite exporter TauE/SafE family protein [Brevundimonas vitis]|uniref:sulfite exporter TauE/SafE family protein n=1 Tax=Brevundimonas vitisensis TaxID=2800818 RepID=UPI001E572063|nr:sulfite exporter TauE/SafE family protein [Brevundimonas vitisensis]
MALFNSPIFRAWFALALIVLLTLFFTVSDLGFLGQNWYYPAIMVVGAFVAGLTPEGGGAVAFPVLSVFLSIDREMARDFSLMIQSVGMTSASIYVLTNRANDLRAYRPLVWFIPVAFVGFVIGMATLQAIPVAVIQALFLSLITTFTIAYVASTHRGHRMRLQAGGLADTAMLVAILLVGGACASLFGTGADIVLYTLLVTRFRMDEKVATHMSIMLMAAISVLGYAYRAGVDGDITHYQVQTWLSAAPVVLFMAPFGVYVLSRMKTEWMLRGIVVLNLAQFGYFNLNNPTWLKFGCSVMFAGILFAVFWATLAHITRRTAREAAAAAAAQASG